MEIANNPEKYISEIEKKYKVNYIISLKSLDIDWRLIYKNSTYFVYQTPDFK